MIGARQARLADEVVDATRRWIGTPYRHQASVRGAGCDCLGLVRGVWRDVLGEEPAVVPAYSADWDEVGRREALLDAASRLLIPVRGTGPGVVLLFRMRRTAVAKHLGIAVSGDRFVHAYSGHGVVEAALSEPWRRRIAARFVFPEPNHSS